VINGGIIFIWSQFLFHEKSRKILKRKIKIKRVITSSLLLRWWDILILTKKRRCPKSDHYWDTFLSFANMLEKLEQRSGMGRLHSCRWIDIRFCAADCNRCFAEAAGDQFDFAFICANVASCVNTRNIRFHF
jgi:hypothetical protein